MAKSSGKSPSARELTDDVLDELVAEAEAGCDLSTAKLRPGPGRQSRDDVPFRKPGWDPLSNSFLNPAQLGLGDPTIDPTCGVALPSGRSQHVSSQLSDPFVREVLRDELRANATIRYGGAGPFDPKVPDSRPGRPTNSAYRIEQEATMARLAQRGTMTELYDPYSHELHDDPYPVYRRLRDEYPLYYCEARGAHVLSRFEDVWDAVHDPATFCSGQGVFPGMGEYNPDQMLPVMIMMDPPRHTQLRSLINRAFTRRRIVDREPAIQEIARDLVADLVNAGGGDLVEDLAKPLPTIVIADLLGVPREDRKAFRQWSDQLVQDNPDDPAAAGRAMEGGASLIAYFADLIAERRRSPHDDLLTALITAEVDGERLSEDELFGMCVLLLVAGNETTTNLVSNSAVLFDQNPDQWRAIVADPSLLPGAVEECLRFDSPVQALSRTLTRTVVMHGRTMDEGDKVLLVYGSANRDEREFSEPDTFDVQRTVDRQLAFGHGIHFCLGAPLARLEAQIVYSELLGRAPKWTVTGAPERMHSGPIRGLLHLPVSMTG